MSGTPGIQGGQEVSLLRQDTVSPEPTEKARNPQRLNRSSIESLKSVQTKLVSSESARPGVPLSSRKVSVVPDDQIQSKLTETRPDVSSRKQAKKEFEITLKASKKLDAELAKLEKKLSEATKAFTKKGKLGTGKEHKQQVKELESKLASVGKALKDAGKLEGQAKAKEKKHTGATPGDFGQRLQKLRHQAGVLQQYGPQAIGKAKVTRDHVLQHETRVKQSQSEARQTLVREKKERRSETREMKKAYDQLRKTDQRQDREVQKRHVQAGKRLQKSSSSPDLGKTSRSAETRESSAVSRPQKTSSSSATSGRKPVHGTPKTSVSSLSGPRGNLTAQDEALARRFEALKAVDYFEGITATPGKKYKQLEDQLWSLKSVDDLKQVVADRRFTKITPEQHRRYLGLLKSAVQGMAKNSVHAEKLSPELIKDLLREQPGEARKAIDLMFSTQADNLQKRLDRHRRS